MNVAVHPVRAFMRHPADIPIEIDAELSTHRVGWLMRDVGAGGLAFASDHPLAVGLLVHVRIALVRPPFETRGRVVWCRSSARHFAVGLQFISAEDAFAARMVEQICHIEHYRHDVLRRDGRQIDAEEAAFEWVSKYAADFARPH